MAAKLTITLAILACIQSVFPLSVVEEPPVAIVDPPPPPPACGANEQYSVCGNLCEDNCDNICEAPVLQWFSSLNPSTNAECQAGCYCSAGFIRNRDGDCVANTPTVCGKDYNRCGAISTNSVYQKCVASVPPACFRRNRAMKPAGYRGRCVCRQGYAMNLQKRCVKESSRACQAEKSQLSSTFFMQTTSDC